MNLSRTILLLLCVGVTDANIRGGKSMESLQRKLRDSNEEAFSPQGLKEKIGIVPSSSPEESRRLTHDSSITSSITFTFESEESGSDTVGDNSSTIGAVFGLNGKLYDTFNKTEIGLLIGSCTVLPNLRINDQDRFCTLQMMFTDTEYSQVGFVIASGTLKYAAGSGAYLTVETTALDVSDYKGGHFELFFDSIDNDLPVFTGTLRLV